MQSPELLIAHIDGIQDGVIIEFGMILAQVSQRAPLADRDLAMVEGINPARILTKVDLPEPLAPIKP